MDDSEYDSLPVVSSLSSSGEKAVQLENGALFPVLLFASLKDAAGCDRISVRVAPDVSLVRPNSAPSQDERVLVSDLLRCLGEEHPPLKKWLPYVKVAVNCEYAAANDAVLPTDEIALLPPVSGGAA